MGWGRVIKTIIIALHVRGREYEKLNRVGRREIKMELGWTEGERFTWYLVFLYTMGWDAVSHQFRYGDAE